MKNNENKQENIYTESKEALNSMYGYIDTDNPCKLYTASGKICMSRLEYSVLLRKAQRYDMLIGALLDNSYLDYCNDLDIKDPEQLLRIFEKDKYKTRQRELLEEKEAKRRESEE